MKPDTIDITTTWRGLLPSLLALLESGTEKGKILARKELYRMAEAADEFVKLVDKLKEERK